MNCKQNVSWKRIEKEKETQFSIEFRLKRAQKQLERVYVINIYTITVCLATDISYFPLNSISVSGMVWLLINQSNARPSFPFKQTLQRDKMISTVAQH